mmetsp:Transcript_22067/g.39569  ORF Transcript_22067/g.39569 Transcript_22067/m.39569 type:complete len:314 (+) Transcript_22067:64-1005(+)
MEFPTAFSLLSCSPDLGSQVCLLILHAGFWWCFIRWSSKTVVAPYVETRPWKKEWLRLNQAFFKKALFTVFPSDEDAFAFACLFQAILAQHLVGGLLCLPSILGRGLPSLACQGALCEAGWELQDIAVRAHQRIFQGVRGKNMNPLPLLGVIAVHHAMGQAMVIPMNILYADNPDYHEFVFLMQAAAFLAMMLQSYGYTLNVQTKEGLKKMQISIIVSWLTILYSRVVRFSVVGYRLARTFHSDGNWMMFYVGSSVLVLMGCFNVMMIVDATQKLIKFTAMLPPEPSQPGCCGAKLSAAVLLGSSATGKSKRQ